MGIAKIQKLGAEQPTYFKALLEVFERTFEMKAFARPHDSHLQNLLKKEKLLVFVAIAEGVVVGGLTAYVLHHYYTTPPLVYVYDLAVEPAYQRRGHRLPINGSCHSILQGKQYARSFCSSGCWR